MPRLREGDPLKGSAACHPCSAAQPLLGHAFCMMDRPAPAPRATRKTRPTAGRAGCLGVRPAPGQRAMGWASQAGVGQPPHTAIKAVQPPRAGGVTTAAPHWPGRLPDLPARAGEGGSRAEEAPALPTPGPCVVHAKALPTEEGGAPPVPEGSEQLLGPQREAPLSLQGGWRWGRWSGGRQWPQRAGAGRWPAAAPGNHLL